jgi:hypothetical protein
MQLIAYLAESRRRREDTVTREHYRSSKNKKSDADGTRIE